eukprot:488951-Prymnesium_polylepis.1
MVLLLSKGNGRERLARVQMVPNTACASEACYVCRWQRRAQDLTPDSGWGGMRGSEAGETL